MAVTTLTDPGRTRAAAPRRGRSVRTLPALLRHLILIVASILLFGPFLWMLLASFKSGAEIAAATPTFLPRQWDPTNYTRLFTGAPWALFYWNSMLVTVLTTAGQVLTSLAAGFAFARLRFPGKNVIFGALLVALMVPFELVFTPLASLLGDLHWLNSYQGLIVPNIPSILGTFLFRQFFQNFSSEIEDAARIDGADAWRRLWSVMAPMAAPMTAAFGILSFVYNWNNFFFQLIVVTRTDYFTVQLGLSALQSADGASQFNLLMAGSTLAILPTLLVYLIFQKRIVTSISTALR
jgi:multiple sugar transport system permease protein